MFLAVVHQHAGVSTRPGGCAFGNARVRSSSVGRSTSFPLLELDHSQATTDSLVDAGELLPAICQTEVLLPAGQIVSEARRHQLDAPALAAAGDVP
jgi:hypothetical protein